MKPLIPFLLACLLADPGYSLAQMGSMAARRDSLQAVRLLTLAEKEKDQKLAWYYAAQSLSIGQRLMNHTIIAKAYRQLGTLYRPERRPQLYQLDSLFVSQAGQSGNEELLFDALQCTAKDYLSNNDTVKANRYIQELDILTGAGGSTFRRCVLNQLRSFYYFKRFRMAESLRYAISSMHNADSLHDPLLLGRSLTQVGDGYVYLFHNDSAAGYLFKALDVLKSAGDNYETGNAYRSLAFMYKTSANPARTLEYYALACSAYISADHPADAAYAYIQASDVYLIRHIYDSAYDHISRALTLFRQYKLDRGIGVAYNSLGRYYQATNQKDSADYYFEQAGNIARSSGDRMLMFYTSAYAAIDELTTGNYVKGEEEIREVMARMHVIMPDTVISGAVDKMLLPGHAREKQELKKILRSGHTRDMAVDTTIVNPSTGAPPQLDSLLLIKQQNIIAKAEAQFKVKESHDSVTIARQENQLVRQQLVQRNLVLIFSMALLVVSAWLIISQIKRRKQAQQEKERALSDKTTIQQLSAEQDHRAGNVLNRIQAIIRRVKAHSSDDASFGLLEEGIKPLMVLHRMLGKTASHDILLQEYFEEISNGLKVSYDHDDKVTIHIDAHVLISGEKAMLLGLILNELVTNSFKHAFADQGAGVISVICRQEDDQQYRLYFKDSGPGIRKATNDGGQQGLLLIRALAHQLNAGIREKHDAGVNFEFYFM